MCIQTSYKLCPTFSPIYYLQVKNSKAVGWGTRHKKPASLNQTEKLPANPAPVEKPELTSVVGIKIWGLTITASATVTNSRPPCLSLSLYFLSFGNIHCRCSTSLWDQFNVPKWNKCLLKEMLQDAERGGYSESLQKMNFLFIDNICELLPITHSPSFSRQAPSISFGKPPSSMLSHVVSVILESPLAHGPT